MKIHEFNLKKGKFRFELQAIETDFHAHPTIEIICSKSERFDLKTLKDTYKGMRFAIINANVHHCLKINSGCHVMSMMECNSPYFIKELSSLGIQLKDGIYVETEMSSHSQKVNVLFNNFDKRVIPLTKNSRIQTCLDFIESPSCEFLTMMKDLKSRTQLSDSRLSHLFKKEVGISIKKYAVWCKLRRTFHKVLTENKNMYSASLECGFYDQAHLSKAFKKFLGISPSSVFNSSLLQI
ncbi:MAG: AraC family transcriptional regulator [Bacteroidota bacterium]